MRRIPILPTLLVLLAVALMVSLGLWQLRRAEWKEGLIARASANLVMAVEPMPARPGPGLDYRRFRLFCDQLDFNESPTAGAGPDGASGWLQKAKCIRSGGVPVMVALGLTDHPDRLAPSSYQHAFSGRVIPSGANGVNGYLLFAERPLIGLAPVAQPTPETAMATTPSGHRLYALQWFLFATVALVIYVLALYRRAADRAADTARRNR